MIQPIELQLAHLNVERSAQFSREAITAAQQTGQGQKIVEESVRRTQMVQASLAAAEPGKVKRREDEENRERRREKQGKSSARSNPSEEGTESLEALTGEIMVKKAPKTIEFYA